MSSRTARSSPTFYDPTYRERPDAAARLSGAKRYLTYARLNADLSRNAQTYGFCGLDLAALCIRARTHGSDHTPAREVGELAQTRFSASPRSYGRLGGCIVRLEELG
jgi:hypothetical protein